MLNMSCTTRILAIAALSLAILAESAAAQQPGVRLPDCGSSAYGGKIAPVQWDRGCTGVADLLQMQWTGWGGTTATGAGLTQLNDCEPSCAEGTVIEYPVRAAVTDKRSCKDAEGRVASYYTSIRISFELPEGTPFGAGGLQDGTYRLACIKPSSMNRCGTIGEPPGYAYDIRARGMLCRSARALVKRVQRARCPDSRCIIGRTRRVGTYTCHLSAVDAQRYRQSVRCVRGAKRVTFYVSFD